MNDHNNTAVKGKVIRAVCGLFQSSCRRFRSEEGSAFERSMEAGRYSEAYYASPMPRF